MAAKWAMMLFTEDHCCTSQAPASIMLVLSIVGNKLPVLSSLEWYNIQTKFNETLVHLFLNCHMHINKGFPTFFELRHT